MTVERLFQEKRRRGDYILDIIISNYRGENTIYFKIENRMRRVMKWRRIIIIGNHEEKTGMNRRE